MTGLPRTMSLAVTGLAVAAGSAGIGLLPGTMSLVGALLVCSCGVLGLSLVLLRRAFPWKATGTRFRTRDRPDPETVARSGERGELRLARLLFYLGCLLVGQSAFRYTAGLTLSEMLFIAAFIFCMLAVMRGNPIAAVPTPVVVAIAIFVFGGAISSFDAQSPPSSAFQILHSIYVLLLWPSVGAMVLRDRRRLIIAVSLFAVSAAVDGVAAIVQLLGGHLTGVAVGNNRMTGLTEHPNDLGGVTAVALVPALMIAARPHATVLLRILRWGVVALIACGLALSGSVSGAAGAVLGLLVWVSSPAVRAPARVSIAAAIVCALAAVVVVGGRVSSPVQRLALIANPTTPAGGSVQDRFAVVDQAWPRISHDPFVGTGLDTADSGVTIISHGYTTPTQIHGLPLAAWYQAGIFGMVGMMGLLAVLIGVGWRGMSAAATDEELLLGLGLLAGFVAFVVDAMAQPMVFQQYGWIAAVFVIAWRVRPDAIADKDVVSEPLQSLLGHAPTAPATELAATS